MQSNSIKEQFDYKNNQRNLIQFDRLNLIG